MTEYLVKIQKRSRVANRISCSTRTIKASSLQEAHEIALGLPETAALDAVVTIEPKKETSWSPGRKSTDGQ